MTVKKVLKDLLTLSSRERTGILVMLMLVIVAIAINLFIRYYPFQKENYDYSAYNREIELFRRSIRQAKIKPDPEPMESERMTFRPFNFDPNTATKEEMKSLGMEERIAGRIIAYREKGGRFHKKEDLLKIYGFDRMLYATLTPYIIIAEKEVPVRRSYRPAEEFLREHPLEINSSDTSVLKELRGIGPVLAVRIVAYRELLGGYYSVDQLQEVYGISDSLFQAIRECVRVDTSLVRKIFINEAGETQLSRHPYIGRYRAKAILSYRKTAGCILRIEELVKNKIIPEEAEARIKAYLSFQTKEKTGDEDRSRSQH
jgi:DNA uptake protein ComE-like DNA-binding protein